MCGICGIRRFGEQPIQRDMIDLLILNNENRGLDATGVALQQADGSVQVYKDNITPYQFLSKNGLYDKFMRDNLKDDTVTVLGHTRKATKGSPRVINNNHPMFAGGVALVHNGHISNDDFMFKDWKLERKAETDSDILRAVLDKEGFTHKAINNLSRLSGNAAFAAISPEHPGKLLLGRSGNPLELAATQDYLIFSSEKGPIYKAMRPFKRVYGIVMREMTPINYFMIGMTDHSAWLLADKPGDGQGWAADWIEWHQEMHIAQNFNPISYMCHAQYHGNRVKFYDDRPVDVVRCPNKACGEWLQVNKAVLADLKKHTCAVCKSKLG
jgi:predicted glutamine amidotransferase